MPWAPSSAPSSRPGATSPPSRPHRLTPDAPQPALRPAKQAADAFAALRHIRAPAAVLENALYHTQALVEQPHAGPLLLEAADGLAAVRTCIPV
nr:hypothetical protein OG409_37585 [Streptomyces sp. NBC_00974]